MPPPSGSAGGRMHLDAAGRVASLGPLADEPVAGHTRFSLLRVVVGAMRISPDRTPSGGLLGAKPRQPSRCLAPSIFTTPGVFVGSRRYTMIWASRAALGPI